MAARNRPSHGNLLELSRAKTILTMREDRQTKADCGPNVKDSTSLRLQTVTGHRVKDRQRGLLKPELHSTLPRSISTSHAVSMYHCPFSLASPMNPSRVHLSVGHT